ncbi:hypothetical protein QBC35DRAFT_183012 [Podospora australis]|uniref:Uncharacterized protein n=1 Tax=Podospora australis TaxID=1536484 RepID=A0AAN6WV77_9PEZI|nr:hypothetical protein QBC35DRAFT_183012 [Podospora australis]
MIEFFSSESSIAEIYKKVAQEVSALNKRLDTAGKVVELLNLFNTELGTSYTPFEYHGLGSKSYCQFPPRRSLRANSSPLLD